jgi:hypothetical protein
LRVEWHRIPIVSQPHVEANIQMRLIEPLSLLRRPAVVACLVALGCTVASAGAALPAYKDPQFPMQKRVDDLVSQYRLNVGVPCVQPQARRTQTPPPLLAVPRASVVARNYIEARSRKTEQFARFLIAALERLGDNKELGADIHVRICVA